MRIFLVGYMGAGKSTIGGQLAEALAYPFVDTDALIAEEEQKTIEEIFIAYGEQHFRDLEQRALRKITASYQDAVIATGGGLPCYHGGMDYLLDHGTVVYLMASIDTIVHRLQQSPTRPLLKEWKTTSLLRNFVRSHLASRRSTYRRAHIRVWNRGEVDQVVQRIQSKL